MNEQELNFSKLSYVNKDFASIYPDLLDLIKELTNRWDPSTSNESDPGVVLIKVAAFLADHLNYNIDKNILECFLPSATQVESVRKIAEFGGYTPRYYKSAIGNVSINYNPETFTNPFVIPAFSLIVTNSDNSITYTQLESIQITQKNVPVAGKFIEGTIQRLTATSDVITLNNLDDRHRIYFPTRYVAENGIFIYNTLNGNRTSDKWTKTNYIYTRPVGTKCYKVDYDSTKELPYIEFPTDIANLIEDGLAIFYIQTSGSYGNVSANELNTLLNIDQSVDALKDLDMSDFIVSNAKAIINGCEPETIDEIYSNYKKVVGTFDTLVSLQDYSNAVKTAVDINDERIVSNGLVTDRRVDYNNAINVCTMKSTGTGFTNIGLNKFGKFTFIGAWKTAPENMTTQFIWNNITAYSSMPDLKNKIIPAGTVYTYDPDHVAGHGETYMNIQPANGIPGSDNENPVWKKVESIAKNELDEYFDGMTPYDLIIYALQKYSETDYNAIYYSTALKNSFKQIPGELTSGQYDLANTEQQLVDALETNKCLSHIFKDLDNGQVYCFKTYVPLSVDIVPYAKVTQYERNEILNNIRKALSDNFNASKVEFGEELNYDTVKKVIEGADSRINYIRLSDFDYYTRVMVKDSADPNNAEEYSLDSQYEGYTFLVDLAAKNVIAGRACLFEFDKNFNYEYCMTNCTPMLDIVGVKTELSIRSDNEEGAWVSSEGWNPSTSEWDKPAHAEFINKYIYGTSLQPNNLKNNEYIEIFYPSYYSEKTYGSYVLYRFYAAGHAKDNDQAKTIPAGTEYTLQNDETLYIYYKDESGEIIKNKYTGGTIIQTSFDMVDIVHSDRDEFERDGVIYNQLASNETISKRVLLQTEFKTNQFVYWLVNNNGNVLFEKGKVTRVLGEGEYFIYTDSNKENLTILGRGTRLVRKRANETMALTDAIANKITTNQLNDAGLASKIPFISFDFSNNPMVITEMETVTLGEGDQYWFEVFVKYDAEGREIKPGNPAWIGYDYLNYELQGINNVGYILESDGKIVTLPAQGNGKFYWVRTRLDLNLSKDQPMQIQEGHNIYVTTDDNVTTQIIGDDEYDLGKYLQSNLSLSLVGNITNDSVDISAYSELGFDINWLLYKYSPASGSIWTPTKPAKLLNVFTTPENSWAYNALPSTGDKKYKYYFSSEGLTFDSEGHIQDTEWQGYIECTKSDMPTNENHKVELSFSLDSPHNIYLPFSLLWYDVPLETNDSETSEGSEGDNYEDVDREYICQLYFENPDQMPGAITAAFVYTDPSIQDYNEKYLPLDYYGKVEKEYTVITSEGSSEGILVTYAVDLLSNASNYIYPITSAKAISISDIYLKITTDQIPAGYLTVDNPKVIWGGNSNLGAMKMDIEARINDILDIGDDDVQFHWLNEPTGDLALMNDNLYDAYSLYDKNNVANIITIPEIDLDNSTIDIVKSMRNY